MNNLIRFRVCLAMLAAVPACAVDLPTADSILDKFTAATGGKALIEKVRSTQASGMFELPAAGIHGTIKLYNQDPDLMYSVVDLSGVGKIEEGVNGPIAWQLSALQGARIKTGEERSAALREANMKSHLDWHNNYKSAETTGSDTVDGKAVWVVVLTPKDGKPEKEYYDKESGLLLRKTLVMASPMGDVPVESKMSDYRPENGMLVPHKLEQSAAGQQFSITLDKFATNVDIPKEIFELPSAIKTLTAK
jgi:hypothetical protein